VATMEERLNELEDALVLERARLRAMYTAKK
jgi:hypothetical protein